MIMKEGNEINGELKQLLDALEEHGKNARRQKQLGDLIDSLEASGKPSLECVVPRNDAKRRRLIPLWWTLGAAAACLAAWLLLKPTVRQEPIKHEPVFVEKVVLVDTTDYGSEEKVVLENPIFVGEPIAEVKPVKQTEAEVKEEMTEEEIVPIPTEEIVDTAKVIMKEPTILPEEPLAVQSPKRRVIKSEKLVGFERHENQAVEPQRMRGLEDKTIFGQPQDPNMKNGTLAMEIKF